MSVAVEFPLRRSVLSGAVTRYVGSTSYQHAGASALGNARARKRKTHRNGCVGFFVVDVMETDIRVGHIIHR